VRAVTVGPRGELVIAAWVQDLTDPAVVLIPAPPGRVEHRGD
jgi:hypothetical protein